MTRIVSILSLVIAGLLASPAAADILELKSGATVDGTFLGGDTRTIRFLDSGGGVETYSVADVANISFVSGAATAVAPCACTCSRAGAKSRERSPASGRLGGNDPRGDGRHRALD